MYLLPLRLLIVGFLPARFIHFFLTFYTLNHLLCQLLQQRMRTKVVGGHIVPETVPGVSTSVVDLSSPAFGWLLLTASQVQENWFQPTNVLFAMEDYYTRAKPGWASGLDTKAYIYFKRSNKKKKHSFNECINLLNLDIVHNLIQISQDLLELRVCVEVDSQLLHHQILAQYL